MANASTVDRVVGGSTVAQGTKAAPTITLVTTTEKLVLDATGATAVVNAVPQGALAATNFDGALNFKVKATFKTTTGGTSTSVVNMYVGSSIVSGNKIASVTSGSLATATASGWLEAYGVWDSVSTKISALQHGMYQGGTAVTEAAATNASIVAANLAALQFCISATNGSSVTGTTFTLTDFHLDVW